MLQQMQDEFKEDLANKQKESADTKAACEETKAANEKQINSNRKQLAHYKATIGKKQAEYAEEKEAFDAAEQEKLDAQEFLSKLIPKCKKQEEEYAKNTAARAEEVSAITDTVAILDNDQSFQNFEKTTTNFVQIAAKTQVSKNERAAKALEKVHIRQNRDMK